MNPPSNEQARKEDEDFGGYRPNKPVPRYPKKERLEKEFRERTRKKERREKAKRVGKLAG